VLWIKKAQQTDSIARESTVGHFRDSLNARQQPRGGGGGHQHMLDVMWHGIERLERLVRDDCRLQTLKQNKVFSTSCPSVYVCIHVCMYECGGLDRCIVCTLSAVDRDGHYQKDM